MEAAQLLIADHHKLFSKLLLLFWIYLFYLAWTLMPLFSQKDLEGRQCESSLALTSEQMKIVQQLPTVTTIWIATRKSQRRFNKMEKTIHQPLQNHPPLGATQGSADSFSWETCVFGPDLENILKMPLVSEGPLPPTSPHPKSPESLLQSLALPARCSCPCLHPGITMTKTSKSSK